MATKRLFFSRLFFSWIVLMALTGSGTALWGQTAGFAYVANCGSACGGIGAGNVSAYAIDGTTGALTPAAQVGATPDSQNSSAGQTRTYYIAADEVTWDYVAGGMDGITGQPFKAMGFFLGPDRKPVALQRAESTHLPRQSQRKPSVHRLRYLCGRGR